MGYLWTEDTSAGLHFWKLVNQLFFAEEFVVESKGSNQGLLEKTRKPKPKTRKQSQELAIVIDDVVIL